MERLKILLMGDASNCHAALAGALARQGHEVTLASAGSGFMKTSSPVSLRRPLPGKAGGLLLWLRLRRLLRSDLRGHDIVSICGPGFVDLRPARIRPVFDALRRDNGAVFMTHLGLDALYAADCLSADPPLPVNEFRINGRPSPYALAHPEAERLWTAPELTALTEHIYNKVSGVTTVLYEYHVAALRRLNAAKVGYIGIPVDTEAVEPEPRCPGAPVNLFLGRHSRRKAEKGTDLLERAARIVAGRHPREVSFTLVEDRPYAEYIGLLRQADIVLDQLYSYTPATNALLAMARAKSVVSGAAEEYYRFIGEDRLRPIIPSLLDFDELVATLDEAATRPDLLDARGRQGRAFVEKHNGSDVVGRRAVEFWTKCLGRC